MPTTLPPRLPRRRPPTESFALKVAFVLSAMMLGTMVLASQEYYFSAPGQSLSVAETTQYLAAR